MSRELGEQSRVLDGDRRLVAESLHQGDLAGGERQDLVSVDDDHSEQLARPEHRDGQHGPDRVDTHRIGKLRVRLRVVNMDSASFQGSPSRSVLTPRSDGIALDERPQLRGDVVGGDNAQALTVEAVDERPLRLAQADRILGQRRVLVP